MSKTYDHHGSLLKTDNKRLRARRFAEYRLRFYGLAAISLAGLALFSLLFSVINQARGAVTESYLTLPVMLSQAELDPDGTGDTKTLLRADFAGLTKDTLKARFPAIKGRSEKRALYDLVSAGAPFELAEWVAGDPSFLGQTVPFRFLASDVTDLYLKGSFGNLVPSTANGRLQIEPDGKTVRLRSTEDDFTTALLGVKRALLSEAAKLRRQAARQNNGVQVFQARADAAIDEQPRDKALAEVVKRTAARDALLTQAEQLEDRSKGTTGTEELSDDNLSMLINVAGGWIKLEELDAAQAKGRVLIPLNSAETSFDTWSFFITEQPESARKISDTQIVAIEELRAAGAVDQVFNWRFFTSGDSREPELAGIWGATVGSLLTMLVTFALAFPIGVMAAIYLEEFAPKNRITDFIEVNINNLAAVPSIVFGLLGLSVFLGVFGVPRSAPLAGGIVLALMTLPTIIIAARAAIRAVPPSIRDAALGVGASRLQTTFHHVLPLAMPGILTGTIIGMAQALGETAPLIMIGMVAFIVDIPGSITDSASVLPVQVFRWSDFPERAFEAKTGAAICVLLVFLVVMNLIAILLRRRFERRW